MELFSILWILVVYAIAAAVAILVVLSILIYITTNPYPVLQRYEEEEYFYDPVSKTNLQFPHINDVCSVNLSVVVPAYNEEKRLPPMLDEALDFLERRAKEQRSFKYEIIVVSDGSKDNTVKVAQSYTTTHGSEKVRCLELLNNRGKGGAVQMCISIIRILNSTKYFSYCNTLQQYAQHYELFEKICSKFNLILCENPSLEEIKKVNAYIYDTGQILARYVLGIFSCRGATILFADADGASKFEDLTKLETAITELTKHNPVTEPKEIANKLAVVIGSRAHLEEESLATRSIFRNILMYGFHFLVWLFTVRGVRDTQCGFKLFTREAARVCFQSLHVNRWAFDVELLYIAQKINIPISEIPIKWTEIDGSKVTPVISWIQMGVDLGLIWLKYTLGAWKIKAAKVE